MVASPFFVGDDTALIANMDRHQRLRRLSEIRAERYGAVAQRLDRYATQYPWMEPGVSLPLAEAGVEPGEPVAEYAAQGSVYAQRYRGLGGYQPGDLVSAGEMAESDAPNKPAFHFGEKGTGPSTLDRWTDQVGGWVGTAIDARQEAGETLTRSQIDASSTTAGTVGIGTGDPMTDAEWEAADEQVGAVLRPAVRAGTVALDTPYQYLQADFRTVFRQDAPLLSAERIPNLNTFLNPENNSFAQTTVGQVSADFVEGRPVELGTGYFADPDSATEQRRNQVSATYGTIGGSVITPGRQAAALVFEPGTRPYTVLSGSVDAAVAIFADPLNVAAGIGAGTRGIGVARFADDASDAGRAATIVDVSDLDDLAAADDVARAGDMDEVFQVGSGGASTTARGVVLDPGEAPTRTPSPIASESTALGGVAESLARRRAAGGIDGTRNFVDPAAATAWLNGPEGQGVVEAFAASDSTYDIWAATGRQMPLDLARRLRDAGTADEVRAVLDEGLGVSVREPLRIRPVHQSRWAYDTPPEAVDLDDLDAAVRGYELAARNAGADESLLRSGVEDIVTADGREGRLTAFRGLFTDVERRMVEDLGVHPDDARLITRMWDEQGRVTSAYAQDRLGNNAWSPQMLADEGVDPDALAGATPAPLLDSEMVNHPVPLPDFRAIRRAIGGTTVTVPFGGNKVNVTRLLLEQGGLSRQGGVGALVGRPSERVADEAAARLSESRRFFGRDPREYRLLWDGLVGFTTFVFKPVALLRPAWTVRVALMEEGVRQSAAGLDSLWSAHPLSAISWMTGRRAGTAPSSTPWDEVPEFVSSQYDRVGPFLDEMNAPGHRIADQTVAERGQLDDYARGVADRLATLHASVVGRNTARADTLDDAHRWYWDGEHVPWAGGMMLEDGPATRQQLSGAGGDWARLADDPDAARRHLEVVESQLRLYTGGDDELLDAVRTGQYRGVDVLDAEAGGLTDDFVAAVRSRLDEEGIPDAMPLRVKVSNPRFAREGHPAAAAYNSVVRTMFGWLGSRPSNYLNRSPAFRQLYAGEMTRLVPWMDPQAQTRWIDYAQGEGNLGRGLVREARVNARAGAGDVDWDTIDATARAYALGQVEELLYSAHRRGQIADSMRLAFPFGEAWKEMISTWGRLLTRRPQNARIGEHGLQTASEGFFTENQWGEQVFTYPMSGPLTEMLTGMGAGPGTPMPLTGRAQGLSMATEVLPGLGPVAQIPASWFIPDTPRWDALAEQVTPYGRTTDPRELLVPRWLSRLATGVSNSPESAGVLAPLAGPLFEPVARGVTGTQAWEHAARFLAGWMTTPENQRTYNSSVMEVATYLASTGDYERTPAGNARLLEDARRDAGSLWILRGLSQSFSPSAPNPEWQVLVQEDGEGGAELAASASVYERYRELLEEDPGTAPSRFMDEFGEDAFLVMQSSTRATTVGAPVTDDGLQWVSDNPEMVERFPLVYGLFAPNDGDFDYRAYESQFASGEREQLSPEEFLALGNNLVGSHLYRQARDEALEMANEAGLASITEDQRLWLKAYREQLIGDYPGYDPEGVPGVPSSATTDQLVRQLSDAAVDPVLAETDAGRGLAAYMEARTMAAQQAFGLTGDPDTFQTRQEFAPTRAWLRLRAQEIIAEHPGFAQIWDRVLDHELDEDVDEAQVVGQGGVAA